MNDYEFGVELLRRYKEMRDETGGLVLTVVVKDVENDCLVKLEINAVAIHTHLDLG